MSKVVRTVGTIVGVALIAVGVVTGNPALVTLGIKVAAVSNIAASAIDIIAPPKVKFGGEGNPLRFATNPQSGVPYAMGRTRMDGVRIHADTTDGFSGKTKNDIVAFAAELSGGGAIDSIESFTADKEAVTFDGSGNAIGRFANYMAQKVHTGGAMASALALSLGTAAFPGWTSAHALSGHTHALWMLRFETDGSKYGAGVPEPTWIGKWVKVYDPRLDSTYPGGSGTHRSNDETTWAWSRNPALHALTWCIGRHQNGKKTLGIGAPVANIRVADFVECANVCDTNHWWCGGVEWSTDSKWDVLKRILQAGGAVPTMTGAMIGCRVNTPRIPVTTISSAHILDELSIPATKPRRDRFNTVIPRYRSEDHEWEVISGAPISVSTYVTEDGGTRIKEIDYPLVQHEVAQTNVDGNAQAGQLAAYDIVNSREAGPIEWTTGPAFIGLKTGDCVTLNVPEEGLSSQDVIITRVALDPSTGKISFTGETETASKHAFALGQSATPPPAFSLTAPDYLPPDPDAADWTLTAEAGTDGALYLRLVGALTATSFDNVLVQYKKTADVSWTMWGAMPAANNVLIDIAGMDGTTSYDVRIAYQGKAGQSANWTALGPVTTAASGVSNSQIPMGVNQVTNSDWVDNDAGFYSINIWGGGGTPSFSYGRDLAGYGGNPRHVLYSRIYQGSALPNSFFFGPGQKGFDDSSVANLKLYGLPVVQGDTVCWGGRVAIHGGSQAFVRVRIFSAAGTLVEEYDVGGTQGDYRHPLGGGPSGLDGNPANYHLWQGVHAVTNAAAAYAVICPWMYTDAGPTYGDTDAYLFFTEPFLTKVAPGQTVLPPYTPGPALRNATSGAPAGTLVGSTSAATVESGANAANNGVNSDGTIKTNKVTTTAVVANSITKSGFFTYSFGGITIGSTGTWVDFDNGAGTVAQTSVAVPNTSVVSVLVDALLTLDRGGSSSDSCSFRVVRTNDGAILNPVYSTQVGGTSDIYPFSFKFEDSAPIQNATNTYKIQMMSNDSGTRRYQATLFGYLFQR